MKYILKVAFILLAFAYSEVCLCQQSFVPEKSNTSVASEFVVEKVTLHENRTELIVSVISLIRPYRPGPWFSFSGPNQQNAFYLSYSGGKSKLIELEGARAGRKVVLTPYKRTVKLFFEPIPEKTKTFDLIEGFCDGCLHIYNIEIPQEQEEEALFRGDASLEKIKTVLVHATPGLNCERTPTNDEFNIASLESGLFDFYSILNRSNFEKVIDEQKLGLSGIIDEATAADAGRLLGAQGIALISQSCLSGEDAFTVKLLDTESSEILWIASGTSPSLFSFIGELREGLTAQ